ncbi:MAG: dihydrodipicolinate reductase [Pseudomonadota bacterium]
MSDTGFRAIATRALAGAIMSAVVTAAPPAHADAFEQVTDKQEFVDLVEGRTLRYPGVRLTVSRQGAINGKGLGIPVTGAWQWRGGFFCRDLFWGERELGANCQAVLRNGLGTTLRFVSDQGSGQSADFRLR